ncbi:hypothetical protein ACW4TU_16630 [Streptomyces sp. QTS52]
MWVARSLGEAIALGEAEAAAYCEGLDGVEYTDFAEAYAMVDSPGEGAEAFSLMRESGLPPDDHVRRFFATGEERAG